jgi:glycosyltransferase involved in cell wall biosynthesis
MKSPPNILIYSPSVSGGVAEHTFYQANALTQAGVKVICLIAPSFLEKRCGKFECVSCLADPPVDNGKRWSKRLRIAWYIFTNQCVLAWQICKHKPDLVLLDSYVEYLSPLWIWSHWFLACWFGVRYAANLHDPVRSYRIGPPWWHAFSVRLAYRPLDFVLVHDKLPDPSPVPDWVQVVEVPVGVYDIRGSAADPQAMRQEWGVKSGQKVFLAFGYVRDSKNLDLAVRALAEVPGTFLVVAGSVASTNDKPYTFYRQLAEQLGVADRCRFYEGFVSDEKLGELFAATDFVLLTYASTFHSQSGVLNIAARARKPVLASASPSPLIESVQKFSLGEAIPPDSLPAVVEGMRRLLGEPSAPRWADYEAASSWTINAQEILRQINIPSSPA